MGLITNQYKKNLVRRYNKEVGIPYYSFSDFKDLKQEAKTFTNSKGIEIHYFFYYYDNYKQDKILLFLPGMGPGHCSYMAEIEVLAKRGYKVLTVDYRGCGYSKGEYLGSMNSPTRDVMDMLDYLKLDKEIILVGHSLGGLTAFKTIYLRKEITKAVVMAPILAIEPMVMRAAKSKFITKGVLRYERKVEKEIDAIDVPSFIKNTTDSILFIQSIDDQMVPYETSLKIAEDAHNPHIQIIKMEGRKHNPNYTEAAVNYMNEVFGAFNRRVMDKKIANDEERIAYFKDVSLARLTEQDQDLFDKIVAFIN